VPAISAKHLVVVRTTQPPAHPITADPEDRLDAVWVTAPGGAGADPPGMRGFAGRQLPGRR